VVPNVHMPTIKTRQNDFRECNLWIFRTLGTDLCTLGTGTRILGTEVCTLGTVAGTLGTANIPILLFCINKNSVLASKSNKTVKTLKLSAIRQKSLTVKQ